ncbi:urease accessory protein UreF [Oscillatoria sp. FACHB-1407]|uniref:urease accessory protein UreF n=1 Tax=Oscillatoria sp. FACHB-1407 TaxID=2692847 RepID=UPI0016840A70|nr:urease accessory protein UreF [Oscillatoria sp. FACHB-1407]MBD2462526.1 urease accessory protein UreF [Oscillatoria sp. FACHB-1407]
MDTLPMTTEDVTRDPYALLRLLQLVSPALPVGAYTYSEGLETLVQAGQMTDAAGLQSWLEQELRYGAIRVEGAIALRAYHCTQQEDLTGLSNWNHWLSAFRETEELRQQSWQMGRSLTRLLLDLDPQLRDPIQACGDPCHFAIAFAIAAARWNIDPHSALLGYLQSWATNLVNAGVKLIPLGQTAGQQIGLALHPRLVAAVDDILLMPDNALDCCSWGVAIASMTHETLYSRLFRS